MSQIHQHFTNLIPDARTTSLFTVHEMLPGYAVATQCTESRAAVGHAAGDAGSPTEMKHGKDLGSGA